jgi:hypothetical protein
MDFKNLEEFCQMFVIAEKKSRTSGQKTHRLDLSVKNLWKIYRFAYGFLLLCDF